MGGGRDRGKAELLTAVNTDWSDNDLVDRLQSGDQEAFRLLLSRHLPRVLRIAERMAGNPHDADDIAQEAMVRLWKKINEWDPGGPARIDTWLYRVTVNLCIDRSRKRKYVPLDEQPELTAQGAGALSEIHAQQLHDIVVRLLSALSTQQRLVLVLAYYEGLSSDEIADIMETTPGAVTGLLHRGRKALKVLLTDMGIRGWANDEFDG